MIHNITVTFRSKKLGPNRASFLKINIDFSLCETLASSKGFKKLEKNINLSFTDKSKKTNIYDDI